MPTIELLAHISTDGRVTVPPIPDWPGGEANTPVYVRLPVRNDNRQSDPARILSNGKTALDDFLDYGKELNLSPLTDKEVDQTRFDALEEKYGSFDDGWRPDPAAVRRFLENRRFTVDMTDEEMEELKHERRMKAYSKIAEQTPEERQAAYEDFMTSWKGCLKGAPHMTAKEIRAERLERKYGDLRGKE